MLSRTVTLLMMAALVGCGGSTPSGSETASGHTAGAESTAIEAELAQVSVDEVAAAIERHDASWAIFDANSRESYDEHHVPGATWVDYDDVQEAQLPADHSATLVFYCANEHCDASQTAARMARGFGYADVRVMGPGIHGWIAAGKPVEGAATAQ